MIKVRAWDGSKFYAPIIYGPHVYRDGRAFEDCIPTDDPVMQYTGLKDKNGVEIYFDDVVKVYGYGDLHVKELCDLCELFDSAAENDIGEILGNIHENPELLTN